MVKNLTGVIIVMIIAYDGPKILARSVTRRINLCEKKHERELKRHFCKALG
jgi:hypothetical protein